MSLTDWWSSAWIGLLYLAIAATIMFIWNLACVPYRIQRDRAEKAEKALEANRSDPLRGREVAAQEALAAEKKRENDRIEYENSPIARKNRMMMDFLHRRKSTSHDNE